MDSFYDAETEIRDGLNKLDSLELLNLLQFDKEQIGIKEPFPATNLPFTS